MPGTSPVAGRTTRLLGAALAVAAATGCATTSPEPAAPPPSAAPAATAPQWSGLASPESVVHDPRTDTYLVSNIDGPVAALDNNGFLARLDPAGGSAVAWVAGGRDGVTLNAPKGIALDEATVWVTDVDTVRGFSRDSGATVAEIPIPGASFLNDIAVTGQGDLLVTDSGIRPAENGTVTPTGTDAVYRIDAQRTVTAIASGTDLGQPNGIALQDDGSILVATRGTARLLLTLSADGAVLTRRMVPAAVVDGVQPLSDGRVVVSTWQAPGLWAVDDTGTATEFVPDLDLRAAPADFGFDRQRSLVLLPVLAENRLQAVPVDATLIGRSATGS